MDRNIDLNIPANTDDGITMANETGIFFIPNTILFSYNVYLVFFFDNLNGFYNQKFNYLGLLV